jgi:hypothetical protein
MTLLFSQSLGSKYLFDITPLDSIFLQDTWDIFLARVNIAKTGFDITNSLVMGFVAFNVDESLILVMGDDNKVFTSEMVFYADVDTGPTFIRLESGEFSKDSKYLVLRSGRKKMLAWLNITKKKYQLIYTIDSADVQLFGPEGLLGQTNFI